MNQTVLAVAVTEAIDDEDTVTVAVKNGEVFTGKIRVVDETVIVTSISNKGSQTVIGADEIVYITVHPRASSTPAS